MFDLDYIAGVIRKRGLHKVAQEVMRSDGLPVPADWTLPEVARAIGTKLARDSHAHRTILKGLESLAKVVRP